jgi:pyruvate,water dikinase
LLYPVSVAALGRAGGKARNIARLARLGMRVPESRVLTYAAAARVADGHPRATARLRDEVTRAFDVGAGVAVRSSADVEDSAHLSYAGQFTSVLDLHDAADIAHAVGDVVASASSTSAQAYAPDQRGGHPPVRMAVLLQQMVRPVVSGVAFTIDPATGLHDVVVEAVEGRGDALVQDGATPQRWVVRAGSLVRSPDLEPLLAPASVLDLAREARRAARAMRTPLDLEWVHDGHEVVWVQARPVTRRDDVPLYSRRIARDVLPGEVLPLVLTVNSEVVNPAWVDVLRSLVGAVDVDPRRMARTFGNRAYFDMTAFSNVFTRLGLPEDSLERLLGLPGLDPGPGMRPGLQVVRHLPRAGLQVLRWARTDSDRVARDLARAERDSDPDLDGLDAPALLAVLEHGITRARGVARHSIEVPLVLMAHEAALRRAPGVDPAVHVRLPGERERERLDPAAAVRRLAAVLRTAAPDDVAAVEAEGAPALTRPGLSAVSAELDALLDVFGHLAERSNNLALTTWAEDPDLPLRLALGEATRAGSVSRTRAEGREVLLEATPAAARPVLGKLANRTGELRVLRERVSMSFGRTYMRLRPVALALGDRLSAAGGLGQPDDVFWLTLDELRAAVHEETPGPVAATVRERRDEAVRAGGIELPDVVIGDGFVPRPQAGVAHASVHGVAASAGRHRGRLRVLHGLSDADRLHSGDVMAVETSDVTWTALFDRAGAVVAESGGLLSHAAVVARERGIPCVVSAAGCTRLPEGALVEVDGYLGAVEVVDTAVPSST